MPYFEKATLVKVTRSKDGIGIDLQPAGSCSATHVLFLRRAKGKVSVVPNIGTGEAIETVAGTVPRAIRVFLAMNHVANPGNIPV